MSMSIVPLNILTMSTREIAELTEKRHDNVVRDFRSQCESLGLNLLRFEEVYIAGNGQEQTEYLLDKEQALTLVSGYNVTLRNRIVQRWIALEGGQSQLLPPPEVRAPQVADAINIFMDSEHLTPTEKQVLKDTLINSFTGNAKRIEGPDSLIDVASLAAELGHKVTAGNRSQLGKHVKREIGAADDKDRRLVSGKMTPVNLYRRDREGLQGAVESFFEE